MKDKFFLFLFFFLFYIFPIKAQKYGAESNAVFSTSYYGLYEGHYTATLPVDLEENACALDFASGLKLYEYRYFTKIRLSKVKKYDNKLQEVFKTQYNKKDVEENLKSYYNRAKKQAWENIKEHLKNRFLHPYETIKNCISFENLDFRAVIVKEEFR